MSGMLTAKDERMSGMLAANRLVKDLSDELSEPLKWLRSNAPGVDTRKSFDPKTNINHYSWS